MKITSNHQHIALQKQQPTVKEQEKEKEQVSTKAPEKDAYIPSQEEKTVTYKKPTGKVDTKTIEALKAESNRAYEQLRELVKQMLEEQGLTFRDVLSGEKQLVADDETRIKAQEAIAEGGPYSAESVSDRLVEFAKAISGDDKSKFDLLKNAIDDGFKAAKQALGGFLPEISEKTYELTMQKLDQWAAEE